jgi:hypothetical protein
MGLMATLLSVIGCDPQRIQELEEGVATEADVRAKFGEPEKIWDGSGDTRIFEYNRQPQGMRNYMISIGPDGKMSALRQVLTPENFARVQPGMPMEDVRRMLGKPAKIMTFDLKKETAWDWRFLQPPGTSMIFTVYVNPDQYVVRTATGPDPQASENATGK